MATNFRQQGDTLTHTAAAAISSGDFVPVVTGTSGWGGVAVDDIANTEDGPLDTSGGVFEFSKPTGAGTDYAQGDVVYWDGTNMTNVATGNDRAGEVWTNGLTTTAAIMDVKLYNSR